MIDFEGINLLAVLGTWIVYIVLGAYWYSPAGFGKQWAKLTGVDIMKFAPKEANRIISLVAVSALAQAFTLAVILNSVGVANIGEALLLAFVLWFGLVMATTVGVTLYQKRSWAFLWLNSAYFLVVMLLGAVILTFWK